MPISTDLETLVQRTSSTSKNLNTQRDRQLFLTSMRADIASLVDQHNVVFQPMFVRLVDTQAQNGLDGRAAYTNWEATSADSTVYWDSTNTRARSIKESFDVIIGQITAVENSISEVATATAYDDTAVRTLIGTNSDNLEQIRLDGFGTNYTLDGDGLANLTNPLAYLLDSVGSVFTGYALTGITHTSALLPLSISQAAVTDLTTNLNNIYAYTGMTDGSDAAPTYSTHGAIVNVADGDNLEVAIQKLDAAIVAGGGTDESVKVSANDTTAGYLNGKLVVGDGIAFVENNDGAAETLTVAMSINTLTQETAIATADLFPIYDASVAGHRYISWGDITTAISALSAAFSTAANVTSNSPGDVVNDSFVFGSTSLESAGGEANRFIYDKTKGFFGAGGASAAQWDNAARGNYATVFGQDNTATGDRSAVVGGANHTISTGASFAGNDCAILGGSGHSIATSEVCTYSAIVGGSSNRIGLVASNGSVSTVIVGGTSNSVYGVTDSVISGNSCEIDGTTFLSSVNTLTPGLGLQVHGRECTAASQSHYSTTAGTFGMARSWGSNVVGGGCYDVSTLKTKGEAQYEVMVFLGKTQDNNSSTSYLYLNSEAAESANAAFNGAGFGLVVPDEGTVAVDWDLIFRENNAGVPRSMWVHGKTLLHRDGTGNVTVVAHTSSTVDADAATWAAGGGTIVWVNGVSAYQAIPLISNGTSGLGQDCRVRLTARVHTMVATT